MSILTTRAASVLACGLLTLALLLAFVPSSRTLATIGWSALGIAGVTGAVLLLDRSRPRRNSLR